MSNRFWDKEYKNPTHLEISDEPSSDMLAFVRWAERNAEWNPFPRKGLVVDIGCGNGRNIVALCREAGMQGYGFDISEEAVRYAKKLGAGLPIKFEARNAGKSIPVEDQSADIALDMMVSHFLDKEGRENLLKEVLRILKPYGWLFFKTFILDGDEHAKRMLKDHPASEPGSYIHPKIKTLEHVWTEGELRDFFGQHFKIHKLIKSYKHSRDGHAWKRRTASLYLEKLPED